MDVATVDSDAEVQALMGQLKRQLREVFSEAAQQKHVVSANSNSETQVLNESPVRNQGFEHHEGGVFVGHSEKPRIGAAGESSDANLGIGSTAEKPADMLRESYPAVVNLCLVLEQVLTHGLRQNVQGGSFSLIDSVIGGWRKNPSQRTAPSPWRYLEAIASAQKATKTFVQTRVSESKVLVIPTAPVLSADKPQGESDTDQVKGLANMVNSLNPSKLPTTEKVPHQTRVHSYPPLATVVAQIRACAELSTDSTRLHALFRGGLVQKCLGLWLAEALLSPAAQGVSGKGGLLTDWYEVGALVRNHDYAEALVAAAVALGALEFAGLEVRSEVGLGEGLVSDSEGLGGVGGAQGLGPGGGVASGTADMKVDGGAEQALNAGGVLNTSWSALTSVGTGAASLVLEGGNAASGLWRTVNSTSRDWGNFGASRAPPTPALVLDNPVQTPPSSVRAGSESDLRTEAGRTDVNSSRIPEGPSASEGALDPNQDLGLLNPTPASQGALPRVNQPGFATNAGSYIPAAAKGAVTAVANAASTLSETSLKPVLSYPFRRPDSAGSETAPLKPKPGPPVNPPFPVDKPSTSTRNASSSDKTEPSGRVQIALPRSGFSFLFNRPASSGGVASAPVLDPPARPFWRRFSSGGEASSSGFDELFPEAEFGANSENAVGLRHGDPSANRTGGSIMREAANHLGEFDPGGVGGGVPKPRADTRDQFLERTGPAGNGSEKAVVDAGSKPPFLVRPSTESFKNSPAEQTGTAADRESVSRGVQGLGAGGSDVSLVPQLTSQKPSRTWPGDWVPGSLFSAASTSIKNGALAPQEILSSVVPKSWPFGSVSKTSPPLENATGVNVQEQTGGLGTKASWWGANLSVVKDPPERAGPQRRVSLPVERDPQSEASCIIYSSGDDSAQSQVPSPQQLASLLGPGAEVLILDGRPGNEIRNGSPGGDQPRSAWSSEDDMESDLGMMLGGGLYARKKVGRARSESSQQEMAGKESLRGGNSGFAESGFLEMDHGSAEGGTETVKGEFTEKLVGGSTNVGADLHCRGRDGPDLSFKHYLNVDRGIDGLGSEGGRSDVGPSDGVQPETVDLDALQSGASDAVAAEHGATDANLSVHRTISVTNTDAGLLAARTVSDAGPLAHRTESDAARGAAAVETLVGVRSPLERLAGSAAKIDAVPRAPSEGVSGQLYSPLHLDDGYLDMVIDMEDVLLDTDGGSGLSRASSSFDHVAHPPSARVPGGGFRRVEVVGVRTAASSPSNGTQIETTRKLFGEGSHRSGRGEVQLEETNGNSAEKQTRAGGLAGGRNGRPDRKKRNEERTGLPRSREGSDWEEGESSPVGIGELRWAETGSEKPETEVKLYEDLLRGSGDEYEGCADSRALSDGPEARTFVHGTDGPDESRTPLKGPDGTRLGMRVLGTEGDLQPHFAGRTVAGESAMAWRLPKGPIADGPTVSGSFNDVLGRNVRHVVGQTAEHVGAQGGRGGVPHPLRVLVAEGSSAAAAAAAMAAHEEEKAADYGTPLDVSESDEIVLGTREIGRRSEPLTRSLNVPREHVASRHRPPLGSEDRLGDSSYQSDTGSEKEVQAAESSTSTQVLVLDKQLGKPSELPLNPGGSLKPSQQTGIVASFSHAAHALQVKVKFPQNKPYTVYILQTLTRDGITFMMERRYRDLAALRAQLGKALPGVVLPLPFSQLSAQKRNVFGGTDPEVVDKRKELFEVCLNSLIEAGPPLATAPPLITFLCGPVHKTGLAVAPEAALPTGLLEGESPGAGDGLSLGLSSPSVPGSPSSSRGPSAERASDEGVRPTETEPNVLGSSIRLIVDLPGKRSVNRQLQAQHNACAGCYRPFPPVSALLSWTSSAARLCEYTGQLYCAECHHKETAILPAYVLHYWDFRPRKVSQIAKAYLDSIFDQPMLCASAVNPHLYSRVPALARVKELRQRLVKMVTTTLRHCPSKRRLLALAGSRRYLLEPGDFFALRDLVDLSKGAFAVLPEMLQMLVARVSAHIASECATCAEHQSAS